MIRQVILKLLQHQVLVGICFAIAATARADEAADKLDFFERKIRPVLVEHCYACHSEKAANKNKLKGGLRLDRRSGAMAGGDSGPVIVAGKPEESLLISALRYESLEMPPTGRLPTEIAKDFEHWVRQGAVWPEDKLEKAANTLDLTDYDYWRASHWAWRPLKNAPLPVDREDKSCAARCDNWSTGAIDRFIFARLKAAGLQPSPPADRAVLFRRLHYDLLGLPPRYEEVQAFLRDDRPDAYRRLVDRLLAAPAYGERWGRHWLDVARYADNGGFNSQTKELYTNFPYAYTYRDYVVRAFNEDLPYDRFIVEQLSADKLELGEDNRALAALGFLTLGDKSFGTSREDRIDDCIDTVTRGLLGVTLSCARCHDHKYDPLPTADYYSLFGVFRNSNIDVASRLHTPEKSERLPLLFESEKERAVHQEQLRRAEHELETASQRFYKEAQQHFRRRLGDYLLAAADRASEQQKAGLAGELVKRWKAFLKKADLSRLSFFEAFGALTTKDSPLVLTREQALELPIHSGPGELRRLRRRLHHVKFDWPRAVALTDRSPVRESFVYIRGNRRKRGAPAPLQFLALLSPERKPFEQGSGRLELARAIVDRQNPLTARVIVNRVWHHHFGRGLVESTSDFGRRSDPPSHPELLDHLAVNFIRKGWSLKRLHRAIVLSQTYRQVSAGGSSAVGAGPAEIDPDNRWLWRMNRRRLSFEALRDSLLAASAELDRAVGGEPVDPWQSSRRTIYGYVNRYRIAAGYETFDFPSSQRTSPKRLQTLTPQQSLFLMNAPFVEERARRLVESLDFPSPGDSQDPLRAIYHRVLSRDPTPAESQAAQQFLSAFNQQSHAEEQANSRWRQLAHALFLCNEFMYVD